jgi:hypothetical protein
MARTSVADPSERDADVETRFAKMPQQGGGVGAVRSIAVEGLRARLRGVRDQGIRADVNGLAEPGADDGAVLD